MRKLTILLTSLLLLSAPALAQEAPTAPMAPEMKIEDIPKTSSAWMILDLRPEPFKVQYRNAKDCETERARIKALGLTSYCIWVK